MKKHLFLVAIIGFGVATLCSCGNKSTSSEEEITVTGSDGKVYTNYREACRNGDFDAAYSILEKKREEFEKFKEENKLVIEIVEKGIFRDKTSYDHSNEEKYNAMVKNYEDGMNYVFNAEMLYLTSQNTEESSNRILYLLAESEIPGERPQLKTRRMSYEEREYVAGVTKFNNRCNSVLDMAISNKNEKLARGVMNLIKENYILDDDDYVVFDHTDIDLAKKKLDDAIESGAFK